MDINHSPLADGVDDEPEHVSLSPKKGRSAYDTGSSPTDDICKSFSPKKTKMVPASRDYRLGHGGGFSAVEADIPVQQMPTAFQGAPNSKSGRIGRPLSSSRPRKAVSRIFICH